MKKLICLFLILSLVSFCLSGCDEPASTDAGADASNDAPFVFKGTVVDAGEPLGVEMEETQFTSGLYHVITSDSTLYFDKNGSPLSREAVKVGCVIEITFGGQVMMSYPPKIAAQSIKVLS